MLRLLRVCRQRLRSLLRGRALDAELDRELAFHLEHLTREKIAEGLPPAEARRAALREFGNVTLVTERSRDQRGLGWLDDFARDVTGGARLLRRSPALAAAAVLSLSIGIGATTAVLGAIDAAFLRPLPFPDADRLVIIRTYALDAPGNLAGASVLEVAAFRERSRTLEAIGVSLSGPRLFGALPDGTPAESVSCLSVTPEVFRMLGVPPARGSIFRTTSDPFSRDALVVALSDRLWRQRFRGAADLVGQRVPMDSGSRRVIAVMPPGFRYLTESTQCWVPMVMGPGRPQTPSPGRVFGVLGRLAPDVTLAEARAEFDAMAADLAREMPDRNHGRGIRVLTLREAMYGWTQAPLLTLLGTVLVVLVIVWINIAGLFLGHLIVREHELGLRMALGATRRRIVRQLLAEGTLVSFAGGLAGLIVAWGGFAALDMALAFPPAAPRLATPGIDARVVAIAVMLAGSSALAFGLVPAILSTRRLSSRPPAISRAAAGTPRRQHRLHSRLVAAQIALALLLLVSAGLLAKSFLTLAGRETRIDPAGLLTFEISVPTGEYARRTGSEGILPVFALDPHPSLAVGRVLDRLRAVDGTQSVAGMSYPPINSLVLPKEPVTPVGDDSPPAAEAAYFLATSGLFSTMGTPVIDGRDFGLGDDAAGAWVAIVNEALARRLWPGERAIGKRIRIGLSPDEREREVIGVVADIPTRLNERTAEPVAYATFLQQPSSYTGRWIGMFGQMTFLVRHGGDAAAVLAAARAAVEPDPYPIVSVGTVERHLIARQRESRNYVLALLALALTATLLAATGVYSVTSQAVNERVHEIGIRRALGAGRTEIASLIARRVLAIALLGLVAGLAVAPVLARLLSAQLWGVGVTDAPVYGAASALLVLVVFIASIGPARRAMTVDPSVVLRCE